MTSDVEADDTAVSADVARIEALMNEKASAIFQLCDIENKGFCLFLIAFPPFLFITTVFVGESVSK